MFKLIKRKDKNPDYSHELHYKGGLYRKSMYLSEGIYNADYCLEDNSETAKQIPFKEILQIRSMDFPDKLCLDNDETWEKKVAVEISSIKRKGGHLYFLYNILDYEYENKNVPSDLIIRFFVSRAKQYKAMKMYVLDEGECLSFVFTYPCKGKLANGYTASRKQMNLFYQKEFKAISTAGKKIEKILSSIAESARTN